MAEEDQELIVINDEDGEYYLIPKDVVERGKVEGDLKDSIIEGVESEVSGFAWGGFRFIEQPTYRYVSTLSYRAPSGVNFAKTIPPGR
jgi:hypothetical protein